MKALILAAGLGTRLRPWTLSHPKALVPVGKRPMLRRVIDRLRSEGFDRIAVNVHHFSGQIVDFLKEYPAGRDIYISDESEALLDTGGALLHAAPFLASDSEPFLVHNVDILSDAPLREIMEIHHASGRDISLVTSDRDSSRKLIFTAQGDLRGWHNLKTGEYRPAGFRPEAGWHESAFSGIYAVNPRVISNLRIYSERIGSPAFPIMDYLLKNSNKENIGEIKLAKLDLIDIGKPYSLDEAERLFSSGTWSD